MKKLILTILTTITILGVNAQGNNLQFNQVLNYEYSVSVLNYGTSYSAGTIIVPQNKVWKITSSSAYNLTSNSYSGLLKINNIIVSKGTLHSISTGNFPIWLKSGNYTVYLNSTTNVSGTQNIGGTISGIEFNIVP